MSFSGFGFTTNSFFLGTATSVGLGVGLAVGLGVGLGFFPVTWAVSLANAYCIASFSFCFFAALSAGVIVGFTFAAGEAFLLPGFDENFPSLSRLILCSSNLLVLPVLPVLPAFSFAALTIRKSIGVVYRTEVSDGSPSLVCRVTGFHVWRPRSMGTSSTNPKVWRVAM